MYAVHSGVDMPIIVVWASGAQRPPRSRARSSRTRSQTSSVDDDHPVEVEHDGPGRGAHPAAPAR